MAIGDKILVVDDEPDIHQLLRPYLQRERLEPISAYSGAQALDLALSERPDLIVLDIMLPDIDGFEVCRRVRGFSDSPVIFLTARVDETDKILGFRVGGDDYVTKPFSPRELMARVNANLRRHERATQNQHKRSILGLYDGMSYSGSLSNFDSSGGSGRFRSSGIAGSFGGPGSNQSIGSGGSNGVLTIAPRRKARFDDCLVDLLSYQLYVCSLPVSLTTKEFELLRFFLLNVDRVFTKRQLFEQIWDDKWVADDNTVTVHIHKLRQKIEADPSAPRRIVTVRGIGYKFVGEVDWLDD